jgi:hypothetical protein
MMRLLLLLFPCWLGAQSFEFKQGYINTDSLVTVLLMPIKAEVSEQFIKLNDHVFQIASFERQGAKILFHLTDGGTAIYSEQLPYGPSVLIQYKNIHVGAWLNVQEAFYIRRLHDEK